VYNCIPVQGKMSFLSALSLCILYLWDSIGVNHITLSTLPAGGRDYWLSVFYAENSKVEKALFKWFASFQVVYGWLVLWAMAPQLQRKHPRAHYAGRLVWLIYSTTGMGTH
jgi:hypothetical protein